MEHLTMGRNNNIRVQQPYEIKCCSIQVKLDEKHLKAFDSCNIDDPNSFNIPAETKEYMELPPKLAEKHAGYVGITMQIPYMYVLFNYENQDSGICFFNEITAKGYEAKAVKNVVYADKRYLEGDFKQKCVTLPPDYIDKAIQDLFKKYCGGEVTITDDLKLDALEYTGDLGGREIHAFVGGGDKMLILGMKDGYALQTNNPCGTYKRMLADFEKIIIDWRKEHSGCAKPLYGVADA